MKQVQLNIIGLCGLMGSGKTTAALILQKLYAKESTAFLLRFSKPLKEAARCLSLENAPKESIRSWYQATSDLVKKLKGESFFLKLIQDEINNTLLHYNKATIIIDDVRFFNEVELIEKYKGITIQIKRDTIEPSSHISETQLLNYKANYTVPNNGTLKQLTDALHKIHNENDFA